MGVVVRGQGLGQGRETAAAVDINASDGDGIVDGVGDRGEPDDGNDDDNDDNDGIIDESREGWVLCDMVTLLIDVVKMCHIVCPGESFPLTTLLLYTFTPPPLPHPPPSTYPPSTPITPLYI